SGLQVTQKALDNQTAQTDLITFGGTRDGRLSIIQIEYNTDLFEDATITRLGDHLVNLLTSAAADPERPLFELPILSPAERQQLAEWEAEVRGTRVTTDASERLERRVAAWAASTPDALAVVGVDARLTYRELDRRANQLAHRLRALGVARGERVGLCVERT